jgi:26S proteasome regulatory subunit N3
MSAHSTAVVRHDVVGQETLLNLLLRNYLHYNLYDQVMQAATAPTARAGERVCFWPSGGQELAR